MISNWNILPNYLSDLSQAKDEYEACGILEHALENIGCIQSSEIYLHDSQGKSHCIVQKGREIKGEYGIILLNHGGHVHGEIRYTALNQDPENIQLITVLCAIASLAFDALYHQHKASRSNRMTGQTSLLLNTVLEMLSVIILQDKPQSIANIAGHFLMGQLMLGTYAIIQFKEDGSQVILSSNGMHDALIQEIVYSGRHDQEVSKMNDFTCVNMMHGGHIHGNIILGTQSAQRTLSEDDVYFVSVLGMIVALALERSRLQSESERYMRLQREMEIAGIVQSRLFPSFERQFPQVKISGLHIPSLEIGGDYMDVIPYPDGSLALIIADVAGKGIGSAMIMSMVKSACALLVKYMKEPKEIIQEINALIHEQTSADIFVTFVFIHISSDRTKLISINAGHESPKIKKSNGEIIALNKGCMVLGVSTNLSDIDSDIVALQKGDMLCMYTDGLFDSTIHDAQLLREVLNEHQAILAQEFMENIKEKMSGLNEKQAQDDKTLLLLSIEE